MDRIIRLTVQAILLTTLAYMLSGQTRSPTPAFEKWLQGLNSRKEGLDRLEAKLKKLTDGPQGKNAGATPRSVSCQVALEVALSDAIKEGHNFESKNEAFHILMSGARDKEYFDLSYIYNLRGALLLMAINKLPSDWRVGFQPGESNVNKLIVTADEKAGCIFSFDSADPFAAWTAVDESN